LIPLTKDIVDMDSFPHPLIFKITNTVKDPGFTVAKILGATKNITAKNWGNPKGITISYCGVGYRRCSYQSILDAPSFHAEMIRVEVDKDEDLNDTLAYNIQRGTKEEVGLIQMVRFNDSVGSLKISDAPGNAGEASIDLNINQDLEFEIPTTNGTDTIVKIFPGNDGLTWKKRGSFFKI
jgi:hypothetical protein